MKVTVVAGARPNEEALAQPRLPVGENCPEGWDGKAAERLVAALESFRSAPATV